MAAIKMLKKEVYELIAAGEVIDRPASIVKELLENSVDAGATSITVEIINGGRTYIRVTDNGSGIAAEDVPTAFLRHATSKVSQKADLDKISTLGFRGEALASICAVSKVEILTKVRNESFGTTYSTAAGESDVCDSAGCPDGTTIVVRDLFYNVPARLKFLKKDSVEGNRIQDLVGKLAISHPEIGVRLMRDRKTPIITAGDGKLYTAVYSVYGREFANTLLPVEYRSEGVSVTGFISRPLYSRGNRSMQLFYVNNRYVHSDECSKALEEAYRNCIMVGKFPMCVLKITLPPDMVDVNVHPAKTEIRFSDVRFVYDAVYFAVKDALTQKDAPMTMKVEAPRYYNESELYAKPKAPKPEQMVFYGGESADTNANTNVNTNTNTSGNSGDDLYLKSLEKPFEKPAWEGVLQPVAAEEERDVRETLAKSAPSAEMGAEYSDEDFLNLCEQYAAQSESEKEPPQAEPEVYDGYDPKDDPFEQEGFVYVKPQDFEKKAVGFAPEEQVPKDEQKPVVVGELFKTYIVAQCGDEMLLIDKHAAHERFIFENIKNDSRNLSAQMLLEPIMVTLTYEEYDAIAANTDKTEKLGFVIEPDVAPVVAVKGLPMLLRDENPSEIIGEIARKLVLSARDPAPDLYDDLYHSMACKAAIKANDESKPQELQKLVDSIYGREDIRYCPHGRPVMITSSKRDIEKQFKRIV